MRTISAYLFSNDGTGTGLTLDLSQKQAELGTISWTLDEELTRVKPGSLSLKVWDEDSAVWTWLLAHLPTTDSVGRSQLLPPFISIQVDGIRRFLGIISPDQIHRDLRTRMIELQAQDWSVMLRDQVLEGDLWRRRLPRVISARTGTTYPGWCTYYGAYSVWWGGSDVIILSGVPEGTFQVGDLITTNKTGATQYRVTEGANYSPWLDSTYIWIRLAGWNSASISGWPVEGDNAITVTRVAQSLALEQPYFSVAAAVTPSPQSPIYTVKLDTVDWLVSGDELRTVSGTLLRVADVDTERREINLLDPLGSALTLADKLYFSDDSLAQIVFEDAGAMITRAAMPYSVDLTRFAPAVLPRPVLSWLPWRNVSTAAAAEDPRVISDLEATLTNVRLLSQSEAKAWSGTPDAGYAVAALSTRYVDWTSQLSAAPARLMPDTTPALAHMALPRNRSLGEWKHVNPRVIDDAWAPLYPPTYTPSSTVYPDAAVGYDYTQFRRLVVNTSSNQISEERWNGSSWSTAVSTAWPVTGWYACSLAPMIGTAATTGPVTPQGLAMLALTTNGTSYELQLIWAGSAVRLAVPLAQAQGAVLRTTPWGVYLFGPGGFGKVRFAAGALALDWVAIFDAATCTLWPETLTALDSATLYLFGRYLVAQEDGTTRTETWAFQLNPSPVPANPATAVTWSELVMAGAPRIAVARRDPSTTARILGVLGGRLFQISKALPRTIERVNPSTMSSGELIEYIAQAQNALVAPRPDGVLEIISRNTPTGTLALTVDQISVTQSLASDHFFSVVRVTGAEDSIYADFPSDYDAVTSTTAGGKALEINSHPLVWTFSHAYAMAAAYGAFLGRPRTTEEQSWFHDNASTAPPWEALRRWERFTVNGGSTAWVLIGLTENLLKGDCKATLLEAP